MTHELKFRYVYGIPGKPETYFFRYFTIDEIEAGFAHNWLCDEQLKNKEMEIISRDQFTGLKDKNGKEYFVNDIATPGGGEVYKVAFINGTFVIEDIETGYLSGLSNHAVYFEIIGNTHGVKI